MRSIQDYYFKKAKEEKYLARSVYKLQEIDQKFHFFCFGNFVLDLGASPGSWGQYILSKIGPKGIILALDIQPLKINHRQIIFVQKDIFQISTNELNNILTKYNLPEKFNVITADLAPKTSGIYETDSQISLELAQKSFQFAQKFLVNNGNFVSKVFESPEAHSFFREIKPYFQKSKIFKPKASRKESREFYIVGMGYRFITAK
ncbi:MAG TPA: RlmE family RNA methyltransferase [Candidatus Portnoybacteria bacterium]|nr:RlmE family RNA methyltransferase [Candidatus Portnoybacteria bacterium]